MPSESGPNKFIKWFSFEGLAIAIIIIATFLTASLEFLGVVSLDIKQTIAAFAAIMGAVGSLSIANAIRLARQESSIKKAVELAERRDLATLVLKRREDHPSLQRFTEHARRVLICDAFLSCVKLETPILVQLVENHCDLTIVALNPENQILVSVMSELSAEDADLKHTLEGVIKDIRRVQDSYGGIKMYFSNQIIPFAGILVETHSNANDKLLIELYPFEYDDLAVHRHHFIVERTNAPDLYSSYRETLLRILRSAEANIDAT